MAPILQPIFPIYPNVPSDVRITCANRLPNTGDSAYGSSPTGEALRKKGWYRITVKYLSDRDLRTLNKWIDSECGRSRCWRTSRTYRMSADFWFEFRDHAAAFVAKIDELAKIEAHLVLGIPKDHLHTIHDTMQGSRSPYSLFGRRSTDGYCYDARFADVAKATMVKMLVS